MKRNVLAVVCLFVVWSVMDYVIHGVILGPTYQATAELWRSPGEMKMPLLWASTLIWAIIFVAVYAGFFRKKNLATALAYGVLLGISGGFGMGFAMYAVMPMPVLLAWVWFVGMVVESTVGGLLLGLIVEESRGKTSAVA